MLCEQSIKYLDAIYPRKNRSLYEIISEEVDCPKCGKYSLSILDAKIVGTKSIPAFFHVCISCKYEFVSDAQDSMNRLAVKKGIDMDAISAYVKSRFPT